MCTPLRILLLSCLGVGLVNARLSAAEDSPKPRTITLERTETVAGQKPVVLKWYLAPPGKMRLETSDGMKVDITDHLVGRTLSLDREMKTATISESLKSTKEHPVDVYADLFNVSSDARVSNKDSEIDGRRALAYESRHELWSRLTWIDEKSQRPVRIKYAFRPTTKPATEAVSEKFRYDSKLDDSLFSLEIPKDYKVVEFSPKDSDSKTWKAY